MRRLTMAGMHCIWVISIAAPLGAQLFEEAAEVTGLDFEHFNGMTGKYRLNEVTGSGVALFDYDGDGDLDAYWVQGAVLDSGIAPSQAVIPFELEGPPRDRLFRNDLHVDAHGRIDTHWVDVTNSSGLRGLDYGMGVAVGDYNGDGAPDLFVSNLGPDRLWRNLGDGSFLEVESSGLGDDSWSTGAVFADYDLDGRLDLFVAHYVDLDPRADVSCYATSSRRDFCGPAAHPPTADHLYRNVGSDRFEDVSASTGIGRVKGPGLGVTAEDFDGDGRLDFLVANDGEANFLWLQRSAGMFVEDGLMSGLAVNRQGKAEASMGASLADIDGDGDDDLVLTHLDGETNTLYEREGEFFTDRSTESGIAVPSFSDTAFGVGWIDVDLDGDVDLLVTNGAVRLPEDGNRPDNPFPLEQPDRLAVNDGSGSFHDVGTPTGSSVKARVGRGLAVGDIDEDGDDDVLINNNSGPGYFLRNLSGRDENEKRWVGLVRPGAQEGEAVRVTAGSRSWTRRFRVGGSYLSSSDPRILLGLGPLPREVVDIYWSAPHPVVWRRAPVGRKLVARELMEQEP